MKTKYVPFSHQIIDGFQIIETKNFHGNNLQLQLILDSLDLYSIQIYRDNDNSTSNLWGCFITLKDAKRKFDTISL